MGSKRRLFTRICIATVLLCVAGVGIAYAVRHPASVTGKDVENIEEAVFLRMAKSHEREVHGLSIDNADPNPAFMARFRDVPSVVAGSHVGMFNKGTGSWTYDKTGQLADCFFIDPHTLTWIGPNHATIEVGAHASSMDGRAGTYTVWRRGNQWVVSTYKDSGIRF